jgi:hypothetical protein
MTSRRFVVSCAGVLAAWYLALALEHLVVGYAFREYFAGGWEILFVRRVVVPLGIAALAPFAPVAVVLAWIAARASERRDARVALAAALVLAGAAVGYGVSFGRHFASWAVRAPLIVLVAAVAGVAGTWVVERGARAIAQTPSIAVVVGVLVTAALWSCDLLVLPRLYPAFHLALYALTLAAIALASAPLARLSERRPVVLAAIAVLLGVGVAVVLAPRNARKLATASNVRLELVEHAPLLGRAVEAATRMAPPVTLDAPGTGLVVAPPGEIARALDWTGDDIVLISVDALRADHLGAYGYARPTTPSIDALAREGVRFDHAYCPTPHTSYSITSMMTGKYMRPLLELGLGDGSTTWAGDLRRYGYRTAAFYPPAVFFIDEDRFKGFESSMLDFEYAKIEFADPELRAAQVAKYLASAPTDKPLFLWVHFFEPHEPYVMHPDHPFGGDHPKDIDAYDSEIAAADAGIGKIVAQVRASRPRAVVLLTADHGEEFGDHGGRYHGTTVYEEQVRVPLVVAAPGLQPRVSSTVVQTIDLLPTVLSALGIPRPPRLRGRDLGNVLAGADDDGLALSETDDYALLARGKDRLVCERRAAVCSLYRDDPLERHDVSGDRPATAADMRALLHAIERDHGHFEGGDWPEAMRRGLQGDADAAVDVAPLLDDANVGIRRKAAEVTFALHSHDVAGQTRRAFGREEDDEVRRWESLALVRMGDPPTPLANVLLHDPNVDWRRRAALAFAEQGDARGEGDLAAWWGDRAALSFTEQRDLLAAIAKIRAHAAVPTLVHALDDVRMRPYVVATLAAIGDSAARAPLLAAFATERYVSMRSAEARALVSLGVRDELRAPLARFAGVAEAMPDALVIARDAGILDVKHSGVALASPAESLDETFAQPESTRPLRLLVLAASPGGELAGTVGGHPLTSIRTDGALHVVELGPMNAGAVPMRLTESRGILAAWLVPLADEIPAPPPVPWTRPPGAQP